MSQIRKTQKRDSKRAIPLSIYVIDTVLKVLLERLFGNADDAAGFAGAGIAGRL